MYILVTYDIQVTSHSGTKRLRKVAQQCKNYGQRVQHSVFECDINDNQLIQLIHQLEQIIDQEKDSIRIYKLTGHSRDSIIHLGIKEPIDFNEPLIL